MNKAVRTLRAVQWSMLASVLLYGILGQLWSPGARAVDPTLNYVFTTLGVAIVGAIFVVRRTLVLRAAESLATQPDDALSLNYWRTGYLATYCLCEALALFGLVLRFLGCSFQQSLPFYIGGFVLLFFFRPKEPAMKLAPGAGD
jgi:F0F1-type ATP synthase membrane subunit c/vacuolar-type H+-ATPase subunit K